MTSAIEHATRTQRRAADPSRSVWVNASAGTGKTKVLVERVLRLLLPRADGTPGSRPDRILCLTYTKAAAAEMTERLIRQLSAWATDSDEKLIKNLGDVLNATPSTAQISQARKLFSRMVDGPEYVRLVTIHSFCQSVLARFPLEAGISPNFVLIQGAEVDELLHQSRSRVFARAGHDPVLGAALSRIASILHDDTFSKLLTALFSERRQLSYALREYDSAEWPKLLRTAVGLPADASMDTWAAEIATAPTRIIDDLTRLGAALGSSGKRDQELADKIACWLALPATARADRFDVLQTAFYTAAGKRREGNGQGIRKKEPEIAALYSECMNWVAARREYRQGLLLIDVNEKLLQVAEAILQEYEHQKHMRGCLDFDDLIRHTADLLRGQVGDSAVSSWVMYKLDGGIDHILVDEAQDTNPEQWQIIKALVDEFYNGRGSRDDIMRTLFVVGDKKQSIYSFQGADAESFERSLGHIAGRDGLEQIQLDVSFRSTAAVLSLTDQVFVDAERRSHIRTTDELVHLVSRVGEGGRVELWPLMLDEKEDRADTPRWQPPVVQREVMSQRAALAQRIAVTIRKWLDNGEMLVSQGRAIQPRDILILVRARQPMLPLLINALRQLRVPVSGLDRMRIMDSIAVQDIVALCRFCLLSGDDLNLACVLKCPLIGLDDNDLIALAPTRSGSLFAALCESVSPDHQNVTAYLNDLRGLALSMGCHAFITHVLQSPCPVDDVGSGLRAMVTRLGPDAREPLLELQQMALQFEGVVDGMQGFIHRLVTENPEIKRVGDAADNVVRLMTVHGAKGLEAPIVILPDTIQSGKGRQGMRVFWPDQTGAALPIWTPRKADMPVILEPVALRAADAEAAEYSRLLYVALTRPRDRLIVAGVAPASGGDKKSWYYAVQEGFNNLQNQPGYRMHGDIKIYECPQDKPVIDKDAGAIIKQRADLTAAVPLSPLLFMPLPPEPKQARPLRPERASGEVPVISPLALQNDPLRFRRGLMTHKLLQVLPNIAPDQRAQVASHYVTRAGTDLSDDVQRGVVREVLRILDDPAFSPVFGAGSQAEVPITGQLADGRLISGQIDRLLIKPDEIMVIDYKTNRPPPMDTAQIPVIYLRQMRAYRDLLALIYPGRTVRCALLWTDGPRLVLLPDALMNGA